MKKQLAQRIFACITAAALLSSMAGCGNKDVNPTKNGSNNGTTGEKDSSISYFVPESIGKNGKDYSNYNPYEGIEKFKGTTVKFATWINHLETEGADPIKSFEDKYGINVELVYCPQNTYIADVAALIATGNSPDIFVDNTQFPQTLKIADDFSVSKVDLNEPIWDWQNINATSVGGKVYGVNTVNSVWIGEYLLIYNRELMELNGIKTPQEYIDEGKWTWDDLLEITKQVNALGDDYSGCAVADVMALPLSCGGGIIKYDPNTGKFSNNITSDMNTKALQFAASLRKQGLSTAAANTFVSGKVGWTIRDAYGIKKTGYYRAMNPLDIGVCAVPQPDENTKTTVGSMLRNYGICKGSKNPEAAGMFIRYFLDPANYEMDNTFVNDDATEWYWKLLKERYENSKTNNVCYEYLGVAETVGTTSWDWYGKACQVDPAQVATTLASLVNTVDVAVEKSNSLIAEYK